MKELKLELMVIPGSDNIMETCLLSLSRRSQNMF